MYLRWLLQWIYCARWSCFLAFRRCSRLFLRDVVSTSGVCSLYDAISDYSTYSLTDSSACWLTVFWTYWFIDLIYWLTIIFIDQMALLLYWFKLLIGSLFYLLTDWYGDPLVYWLTGLLQLIYLFGLLVDWFYRLPHWLTGFYLFYLLLADWINWCIGGQVNWFIIGWLIDWLMWLVDFANCLIINCL